MVIGLINFRSLVWGGNTRWPLPALLDLKDDVLINMPKADLLLSVWPYVLKSVL